MEFGVAGGVSLQRIANMLPGRTVYGFDWFQGLPEDWATDDGSVHNYRGTFACKVPQHLPSNVELVIGLFQDTLPQFLQMHSERAAFVHFDCDLYSSTKFVLSALRDRLPGAIVAFDEFRGERAYEQHEGRAWREFVAANELYVEELPDLQLWVKGATFRIGAKGDQPWPR